MVNTGYSTCAPPSSQDLRAKPDETDYTGNPHGKQASVTEPGGVGGRPRGLGKGVQIAEVTTNTIINLSFDADVTNGWTRGR